jgi:hypothetical protein
MWDYKPKPPEMLKMPSMAGNQYARKHGLSSTPEYFAFMKAKSRCQNPKDPSYKDYGAKGIQFLFDSLDQWLGVLGRRPAREYSVDRWPDPYGPYSPKNVRWATALQQQHNRRDQEGQSPKKMFMRGADLVEVAQVMLRNVNGGTQKSAGVRRENRDSVNSPLRKLAEKAIAIMRQRNVPPSSVGKGEL